MPATKRKLADGSLADERASKRGGSAVPISPASSNRASRNASDDDDDYLSDEDEDENEVDEEGEKITFSADQKDIQKRRDKAISNFSKKSTFAAVSAKKNAARAARSGLFGVKDFSDTPLKPDHESRCLWIDARVSEGSTKGPRITLESFHPLAKLATDLLTTIAEPISRPQYIHEYRINEHSLYAALSVGLKGQDIISALDKFCKHRLPDSIRDYINSNTKSYGKVRLVLRENRFWVESEDEAIISTLLRDSIVGPCKAEGAQVETAMLQNKAAVIQGTSEARGAKQAADHQNQQEQAVNEAEAQAQAMIQSLRDEDDEDDEQAFSRTHSFEIAKNKREVVAQRCLEMGFPAVSEYDFANDRVNASLPLDLKPATSIRPYQEKALSKMFGNNRAKSGIIVLPCGAGKTLVGITAACHIKKSVVVLCTSAMSVHQWAKEFKKWSDVREQDVATFTAEGKQPFKGSAGVLVSTYSMMAMDIDGKAAHDTKKMLRWVQDQEWGLMILDEVHVVPAKMFRKVGEQVRAHCKLGLTATLLREDDKISDLNFLIGPKLYEANWMELADQGHIAKVQCAEVWCPMSMEFYSEYQKSSAKKQLLFYACNPVKYQVCQFLINYHEKRGDKIIVFSDNLFALEHYAKTMMKPYIYGGTSNAERLNILENFQHNEQINTVFLSKIGDTSLDLPEATCLIQISSHYGSRRQEAQRLGRILRAKRRNDEGFNAFFYSLVSKDTTEMAYSAKRQAFLVDQGYAFKTITHLNGMDKMPGLAYRDPRERQELLASVLMASEDAAGIEEVKGNMFSALSGDPSRNAKNAKKGGVKYKRQVGTLADASGGGIMAPIYAERNRGQKKEEQSEFFRKEMARRKRNMKKNEEAARASQRG